MGTAAKKPRPMKSRRAGKKTAKRLAENYKVLKQFN
jgi:hypothetical protein